MSKETTAAETTEQEAQQPEQEPQGDGIDWKSESRKWEALAKKGKAAEEELEKLKQERMTEQEKAVRRAEKAEGELAAMQAEAARLEAARKTADKTGVPVELLEFCADEDAMGRFARIYEAKKEPVHAAATAQQRIDRGQGKPVTPAQQFAEALGIR